MESVKAMHEQVGDLCFTADGIAKKGVLVRHLVMPGMADEGKHIMKWLAEKVSKDLMLTSPHHNQIRYLLSDTTFFGYQAHITTSTFHSMVDIADLIEAVHQLKVERDTWQAVAFQYRGAFEAQTAHLRELQDICFATQAELENEHAQYRRLHPSLDGVPHNRPPASDCTADHQEDSSFGTATLLSPDLIDMSWRFKPSESCCNPIFKRVQQISSQQNYGTALVEIDRLLRGPLSSKARAEGLLLKSSILQATGPDALYDALAACSEALEIWKNSPHQCAVKITRHRESKANVNSPPMDLLED
ncbi:hypothetical protein N0V95_003027 [Ascochyta clinopodiicola]|nr:hypothetical protein N0V95_003027 [Ascochyta clinopodiicola]